jgi:antitoxin (DNA-binding transcriptional repressor) of toxin-antitoxin stability system
VPKSHSIHAAKTNLSRLIANATAGEEVIIMRGKTPVVRLVPAQGSPPKRQFGAMRGRARTDRGFFDPLPAEELDAWNT